MMGAMGEIYDGENISYIEFRGFVNERVMKGRKQAKVNFKCAIEGLKEERKKLLNRANLDKIVERLRRAHNGDYSYDVLEKPDETDKLLERLGLVRHYEDSYKSPVDWDNTIDCIVYSTTDYGKELCMKMFGGRE